MSQQLTLDKFFVKTANTRNQCHEENMSPANPKKRNLSLTRVSTSPCKCMKSSKSDVRSIVQEVGDLCNDDSIELKFKVKEENNLCTKPVKNQLTPEPQNAVNIELSTPTKSSDKKDTSDSTIEYSLTPEVQNITAQQSISNERSFIKVEHDLTINSDDKCDVKPDIKPSTSTADVNGLAETSKAITITHQKEHVLLKSPVNPHNADASSANRSSVSSPQTPQSLNSNGSPVIICVGTSTHNPNQLTYYSPSKKRNITQKNANARRNLNTELSSLRNYDGLNTLDLTFVEACAKMDDKTNFMLNIIYRYLKDESLHQLLDSISHDLLCKCLHVTKPGMQIVCRLHWRKKGWYKQEELEKLAMEMKSVDVMKSLIDAGLIIEGNNTSMTFNDYINILKREELLQICKNLNIKMASKQKQEAVLELLKFSKRTSNISNYFIGKGSNNMSRLLSIMCEKSGPCYKLSDGARSTFYRLYVMMYLGMNYDLIREKRLELTLIYEKVGRETYPVDKGMELDSASFIFSSRDEFESYITAHTIYEDYIQKTDLELKLKCNMIEQVFQLYKLIGEEQMSRYASLPSWLRRYTPVDIYIKLLDLGVKELKKRKDKQEMYNSLAISILDALIGQYEFRQHRKAEWYAEKALILHNNRLYNEAANVLLQGFNSDMSDEAKDTLRPRALKIANKSASRTSHDFTVHQELKEALIEHATSEKIHEANIGGEHIHKPPMERDNKRGKLKFETKTVEGRLVQEAEEYCIEYYICNKNFTNGEHWEGIIVTTIFYLLFWDIIYSKPAGVRGVFLSHYQKYPLDLFTDSFYTNRKTAIDNQLAFIENATIFKLLNIMQETWNHRPESELSGINRSIGWNNVSMVCTCLGPRRLSAICRRLTVNYHYTHSGFPDLTLWNRHNNRIKFVEVKTDSDKPSMKQIQWMNFLKDIGVETEFCYVGVNTTRQKCRKDNKKSTPQKVQAQPDTASSRFECDKCGRVCRSKIGLTRHQRRCQTAQSTKSYPSNLDTIKIEVDSDDDFQILLSTIKVEMKN